MSRHAPLRLTVNYSVSERFALRSARPISHVPEWVVATIGHPPNCPEFPKPLEIRDNTDMSLRLPSLLEQPISFAHRGARAHAPENTVAAFDLAIRLGATGIESDVWLTADGELVLEHGGKIGIRRRPISSFSRADLPAEVITLPELQQRVGNEVDISIDIKDDDAMAPVMGWVDSLSIDARKRIWLCHESWEWLAEWRSLDPHVRLVDSCSVDDMNQGLERRAHQLAEAGIDAVNLRRSEWSGGNVTLFHRFGRICFGWDAQHGRVIRELLRMGIDGVYSDHVDVMAGVFAEHFHPTESPADAMTDGTPE